MAFPLRYSLNVQSPLVKPACPSSAPKPFSRTMTPCRHGHSRMKTRAAETETGKQSYSLAELSTLRKQLQQQLDAAVRSEEFREAARLKAQLEELNRNDPVMAAKTALQKAIAEERYEEAAEIQARIKQLETELGAAVLDSGLLSTSSDTVTHGIRVQVQSVYQPLQSQPAAGRWIFTYHITITNQSDRIVQLRNRHWIVMDGRGKVDEVRGPGVVGEQPIIVPGKSFTYKSGCPLPTSQGSMEGTYTMVVLSPEDGQWADTLEVRIGKFKLDSESGPQA